jgi:hypothetical protein
MKTELPETSTKLALGSYAEEIRSNADVTGNLNSQFKYNQSDDGPYQEMSKGASVNRYLEKIAMSKNLDRTGKLGVGISSVSLGLGLANYHNSRAATKITEDKSNIERKSLTALNNINKTLSTSTLAPSPVAVTRPKFNNPTR